MVRMIHGYCVVYKHFSLNERLQNMGALMIMHKFNDTDTNKLKQKLWATLRTTVSSRMLSHQNLVLVSIKLALYGVRSPPKFMV